MINAAVQAGDLLSARIHKSDFNPALRERQ
jgi:hypothetical protein